MATFKDEPWVEILKVRMWLNILSLREFKPTPQNTLIIQVWSILRNEISEREVMRKQGLLSRARKCY